MNVQTTDHPRVTALCARFAEIDAIMRPLPVYNPALQVATYGFRQWEGALLGVLVTPWFMNLVLLPEAPEALDPSRYGAASAVTLPGGTMQFLYNGDPALGAFRAASLHSPMEVFKSQPQALAEARLRLIEAVTPPQEAAPQVACPSRRRFLGGGKSAGAALA